MRNPFLFPGPVRNAAHFFGRTRLLQQVRHFLDCGQSVSIVGPRRIGKTSLLFRIAEMTFAVPTLVVPIDCQNRSEDGPGDFYAALLGGLQDAAAAHEFASALPAELAGATSLAFRHLEQAVRALTRRGVHILFLFDEFDSLSQNPYLDANVFAGLRSLAMRFGVMYVSVSTRPLLELTYSQTSVLSSPFFNFFAPVRLGLLEEPEAEALLRETSLRGGAAFDSAQVADLIRYAGLSPLMLQMAGYYAWEYADDFAAFERHFSDATRDHFEYAWDSLLAEDRRLLTLLPVAQHQAAAGVVRLEHAALIVRTAQQAVISSAAFAKFVSTHALEGMLQVPPITLDLRDRIVLMNGSPLSLTPSEFNLLTRLMEEPNRVMVHAQLEACLDDADLPEANTAERLKTTLRSLRQIVGHSLIQNERGIGYRFVSA